MGSLYPDIFLYIPALLRLLGVSAVFSYHTLLLMLNAATVFGMYLCIKSITLQRGISNAHLALCAAILYAFAPYRLNCMYIRSALGETLAMIFLPFVITGLYHLFIGDKRKYYFLIIGYTGVLYSHLLSAAIAAALSVLLGIIYIAKIFKEKRIVLILKSIFITLLLNASFLVPFVYYQRLKLNMGELLRDFSSFRVTLTQLISFSANHYNEAGTLKDHPSIGPIGLLIMLLIIILLIRTPKNESRTYCFILSGLALLCLLMTTTLFPWNILQQNQTINRIVGTIQFPWRMLGITTVIGIIVLSILLTAFEQDKMKGMIQIALLTLSCICIIPIFYVYHLQPGNITRISGGLTEGRTDEYLPSGTEVNLYQTTYATLSNYDTIHAENYYKNGTTISFQYTCDTPNEYVDLPLLYYPNYHASYINSTTNQTGLLTLGSTENNCIRLSLESTAEPYIVTIKYIVPWYFKLAFIVSLLTLAIVCRKPCKHLFQSL